MRKVLLVTEHLPGRDAGFQKSGHGRYLQSFIDFFSRPNGFETTLLVLRPKVDFVSISQRALPCRVVGPSFATYAGRLTLSSFADVARCLAWYAFARAPQPLKNFASALRLRLRETRGYSHDLGRTLSKDERAYVVAEAERIEPDVVVFDGIFNECGTLGRAQHWIITHEVKYQRAQSFAARGIRVSPADFDRESERSIIERVGNVIAIQWDDAREFRQLAPRARVVVVPAAMDIPALVPQSDAPVHGRCVFVGSGSFHNYDGIQWFLDSCWEAIRARVPDATLEIVGTVCYRLGRVPAGVTLMGVVDNVETLYRRASIALVPLRMGSGLKVKLIEALAHGVPVVTTSIGAQGLAELEPRPFAIGDDVAEFVDRCIEILDSSELRAALSRSAQACSQRFTPTNAFHEFADALAYGPAA